MNWLGFTHKFLSIISLVILLFIFVDCGDDSEDKWQAPPEEEGAYVQPMNIAIIVDEQAAPSVMLAARDAASLLKQALHVSVPILHDLDTIEPATAIVLGDHVLNEKIFTEVDKRNLAAESFRIRSEHVDEINMFGIYGPDNRGLIFGLYDLLERFGFGFYHPEQTLAPDAQTINIPENLDVYEHPSYERRGFHIHTMHPTPHSEFLQRDDPTYLVWSKNLIDWHVRNKQNYMQWELLRTVDYDANVKHFQAIVDYAHERGMDIGIVVTFVFIQQKAWRIIPSTTCECYEEMKAGIDQLMQADWDHIHLEMGSSEFTKVDDRLQVKWMDNVVRYLREAYPNTDSSVKVHCSSEQTAPHYGDINFNYLAQFADSGMGVYPHTVQFYDLQGPAPAYGNEDFHEVYEWMLQMVGQRKVYYYPETAYWCSMDIDVPLFLPVYLFNRWKDIDLLKDKGIDGHVTFTSGHEWTYWLSDWVIAKATWNADRDWREITTEYTSIFGDVADDVEDLLEELTLHQEDFLIGENLISYISGSDTWDEIGYWAGVETHPKPVLFKEIYKMGEAELTEFQVTILPLLAQMAQDYTDMLQRLEALRASIPDYALPWFDELEDSFRVNHYRANHAHLLYKGVCLRRSKELGLDPNGETQAQAAFDEALAITPVFLEQMRDREADYRYPVFLSSGWERSLTSYDYRFLWQASTGYWYKRAEKQAIDKESSVFLMNVIDPIWFFL